MSEVDRFFRQLVSALAASGSDRLRQPVTVGEISGTILPYRAYRRALQLDTSEDYELALLRLAAGEGGLAHTEPPEALALFQSEAASANPDLAVLARASGAALILAPRRVADALGGGSDPHRDYAPPPAAPAAPREAPSPAGPPPIAAVEIVDADDALPLDDVRLAPAPARETGAAASADEEVLADAAAEHCSFCGGALPAGRIVNFCPHCGQSQSVTHCPECRTEVELGWRHCITCGFALGG